MLFSLLLLSLIFVFRNGIIREKCKYIQLRIDANNKNCLYLRKKNKKSTWTIMCSKGDTQCYGDNDCNVIKCNKDEKAKHLNVNLRNKSKGHFSKRHGSYDIGSYIYRKKYIYTIKT